MMHHAATRDELSCAGSDVKTSCEALCCDVMLVSPLRVDGRPRPALPRNACAALEHAVARVCREAHARHVRLADMNLDVPVSDERRIETLASLPPWHGSQLALNAPIMCLLTHRAKPFPHAAGGSAQAACNQTERAPAFAALPPSSCRLEVGGSFGADKPCNPCASSYDAGLPPAAPGQLRLFAIVAWISHWFGLAAAASQHAYAVV